MHDVVWLHHMSYQKTNSVGELNMDHICVGNWSHMTEGVSRFIEEGEGISDEEDKNHRKFIALQMIQMNLKTNQLAMTLLKKKNLQMRTNALLTEEAL